ncbi:hypothetical protein ACFL3T_04870 [Patescibacteria group bacterium]
MPLKQNPQPQENKPLLDAEDHKAMSLKLVPKPIVAKVLALIKELDIHKDKRSRFKKECAKSTYKNVRFIAEVMDFCPYLLKLLIKSPKLQDKIIQADKYRDALQEQINNIIKYEEDYAGEQGDVYARLIDLEENWGFPKSDHLKPRY